MSDTASNMPARIWADLNSPAWSRSLDQVNGFDSAMPYYRADIVERMVEAASKFVAACSDKRGEWNGLSFIDHGAIMNSFADVRDALNSYREDASD